MFCCFCSLEITKFAYKSFFHQKVLPLLHFEMFILAKNLSNFVFLPDHENPKPMLPISTMSWIKFLERQLEPSAEQFSYNHKVMKKFITEQKSYVGIVCFLQKAKVDSLQTRCCFIKVKKGRSELIEIFQTNLFVRFMKESSDSTSQDPFICFYFKTEPYGKIDQFVEKKEKKM